MTFLSFYLDTLYVLTGNQQKPRFNHLNCWQLLTESITRFLSPGALGLGRNTASAGTLTGVQLSVLPLVLWGDLAREPQHTHIHTHIWEQALPACGHPPARLALTSDDCYQVLHAKGKELIRAAEVSRLLQDTSKTKC